MYSIDINCDLGEGNNIEDCNQDRRLMPYISSCNIACGGHAGNQLTMTQSVKNAISHNLKIGAHPSYPDPENFGRKSMVIELPDLKKSIELQIDKLKSILLEQGKELNHIKFHGALYNDIESNPTLASELGDFCHKYYPEAKLMGLSNGNLTAFCSNRKLPFIAEGFMDRRYQSNGQLVSRKEASAVIEHVDNVVEQALSFILNKEITTIDNQPLSIKTDSLCLHGDNPNALSIAKRLNQEMINFNIKFL